MMQLAMESWIYLGGVAAILAVLIVLAVRKPQAPAGVDLARFDEVRAERDDWRADAEARGSELAEAREQIARMEAEMTAARTHHAEKARRAGEGAPRPVRSVRSDRGQGAQSQRRGAAYPQHNYPH